MKIVLWKLLTWSAISDDWNAPLNKNGIIVAYKLNIDIQVNMKS